MRAPGIAALVVFTSVPAIAADTAPPAEVFAGYSYTKDGGQGLNGGEASLAIRLTGKFKTAFPDGKPAKKDEEKKDAEKKPEEKKEGILSAGSGANFNIKIDA